MISRREELRSAKGDLLVLTSLHSFLVIASLPISLGDIGILRDAANVTNNESSHAKKTKKLKFTVC
jgi:hypothetical protein